MNWLTITPITAAIIVATTAVMYCGLVVMTRMSGLRSFSKISSFDFAVTVSIGSVFAGTILSKEPSNGLVALAALFAVQWGLRRYARAILASQM